jgi:hypothetical protein
MPFKSMKQMKYMFSQHPDIAKRWEDKYGPYKQHQHKKYSKKGGKKNA